MIGSEAAGRPAGPLQREMEVLTMEFCGRGFRPRQMKLFFVDVIGRRMWGVSAKIPQTDIEFQAAEDGTSDKLCALTCKTIG